MSRWLENTSPVDDERVAGDEFCGREIGDRIDDVRRTAAAFQRSLLDEIGFEFGRVVGQCDRAGRDGVDADFGREFFREATRQHDDAGFGDGMGDVAGPAEDATDIGEIDDAAVCFLQKRRRGLRAEERCLEIRVERFAPLFFRRLGEFGLDEAGGAVDQNVEAAELRRDLFEQRANLREVVEVGLQRDRSPRRAFRFRRRLCAHRLPTIDSE